MFDWEVNVKKKQWKYMVFNKRSKIIFSFFVVSLVHLKTLKVLRVKYSLLILKLEETHLILTILKLFIHTQRDAI